MMQVSRRNFLAGAAAVAAVAPIVEIPTAAAAPVAHYVTGREIVARRQQQAFFPEGMQWTQAEINLLRNRRIQALVLNRISAA